MRLMKRAYFKASILSTVENIHLTDDVPSPSRASAVVALNETAYDEVVYSHLISGVINLVKQVC